MVVGLPARHCLLWTDPLACAYSSHGWRDESVGAFQNEGRAPQFECPFTANWTDYFEGGVAGTAGVAGIAGVAGTAGVVAVAGVAGIAGVAGFAGVAGVAPPARATLTDVKTTTPSMTSVAITFIGDLLLRYRVSFLQLSDSPFGPPVSGR
jgi:hypothetical protein